ncbi:type II toxin-antitoxin system VapC family toxin [Thauera aromatica]|uniref:PIN domain-containing protein n=1 Tax=Thauera aromatica K172 TaxID=44139 RepID=A0A2R4BQ45_THAAR|nr:PIN domain-containing protein [Thauera aromatica]AVR89465.1 PIN domain-containing protein [Thauera aromatica K172]
MILVDLNVALDVFQARDPHYAASAAVLDRIVSKQVEACVSAHAVTTIHYLVGRYRSSQAADEAVDWLIRYFHVASVGREQLIRARSLGWGDFEDAVVAAAAESAGCTLIVSRNIKDFFESPVPALMPEECLATFGDLT